MGDNGREEGDCTGAREEEIESRERGVISTDLAFAVLILDWSHGGVVVTCYRVFFLPNIC